MWELDQMKKNCCNKRIVHDDGRVEIKTPYPDIKEHDLLHRRLYIEKWLDQYNHIMEFSRTAIQSSGFIMQLIILWKLFQ